MVGLWVTKSEIGGLWVTEDGGLWVTTHKPTGQWVRAGLKNGDLFGGTWRIS